MRKITVTQLRGNIYNIIDEVLTKGESVEIERKGKKLRLVSMEKTSKLDKLTLHPGTIIGDPEDLVEMDWSTEWNEKDNL